MMRNRILKTFGVNGRLLCSILISCALVTTYCGLLDILSVKETQLKLQKAFQRKPKLDMNTHYICQSYAGRTGNHMFQYASIFGISRKYNHTILLEEGRDIEQYFKVAAAKIVINRAVCKSFKRLTEKKCCEYDVSMTSVTKTGSYVIGDYLQSWKYFENYIPEVKQELAFKPWIREPAQYIVNNLKQSLTGYNQSDQVTTVGVHVRLGDILDFSYDSGGFDVAPEGYIQRAIDYFLNRFKNVLFIVCSDGINYAQRVFRYRDVKVEFINLPAIQDMAVLASCDHVIMTVGSFGWWAGFLSGGTVVYYKYPMKEGRPSRANYKYEDYFLPSWVGLG